MADEARHAAVTRERLRIGRGHRARHAARQPRCRQPGQPVASDAVLARDFPVIQGVILFFAFLYVMVNLLVDLSYLFLDPRIRY